MPFNPLFIDKESVVRLNVLQYFNFYANYLHFKVLERYFELLGSFYKYLTHQMNI